jgi:nuclease HARBI1
MLPNGMFGHLFRLHEGRRNDCALLNQSQILKTCTEHAVHDGTNEDTADEEHYFQLFEDLAYGVSAQIQSPFSGLGECMEEEKKWNEMMLQVRIVVEHGFGIIANTWPFLNAGWKMHLGASPVGCYYCTGVLLSNGLNCLCPN